jgi:hypothetical protein
MCHWSSYLLLGLPKGLGIEHADHLPIRSLALDPVVGCVVRNVDQVVCQTLKLEFFCEHVLSPEVRILSQPKEQGRARWHPCILANLPQRCPLCYAFANPVRNFDTVGMPRAPRVSFGDHAAPSSGSWHMGVSRNCARPLS